MPFAIFCNQLSLKAAKAVMNKFMSDCLVNMNFTNTVKSLNFMGMKFLGLTMMDMIVGQLNFWILNYMQYN